MVTDHFSKWVVAVPLEKASADETAGALVQEVFLKYGAPRTVVSDRGTSFMSKTFKSVLALYGTTLRPTSPYHPQSNGQTERTNRTVAEMLSKFVCDDHSDWDVQLPFTVAAYNAARHSVTGYSPFFVLFGREPRLAMEAGLPEAETPPGSVHELVQRRVAAEPGLTQLIQGRIRLAGERSKVRHDLERDTTLFEIGDLVLVRRPIRQVGRSEKLLPRYDGPYEVTQRLTDVSYGLKLLSVSRSRRRFTESHVTDMKPYHPRDAQTTLPGHQFRIGDKCMVMDTDEGDFDGPWEVMDIKGNGSLVLTDKRIKITGSEGATIVIDPRVVRELRVEEILREGN
jgi:hypothetical protein